MVPEGVATINHCEWLTVAKAKLAEMALIVINREAKAKAQMKTVYDRNAKEKTLEQLNLSWLRNLISFLWPTKVGVESHMGLVMSKKPCRRQPMSQHQNLVSPGFRKNNFPN